jgi:class 3 adenylate cyclase
MLSLFRKKPPDVRSEAPIERMARYNVPPEILDKLALYVREASDRELYKVNPRYLAARLGVEPHTTLGILAYAVQEGLFDLNWDVHCPHHGEIRTFPTLQDGRSAEYCPLCQASFDVHLDDEIHVTFTVNELVRKLSVRERLSTQEPLPADDLYPPTYGLELLNVQPFRDLFADETLPPGESVQVKRVAFMFTDLLGSTAMYARAGDPKAYGRVRDHFEVLFQAANRNHGVTVKTIGDAVMASFVTPGDALRMTVDVYRGIAALNRRLGLSGDDVLSIRLGAHVGSCISVTLNERLDYFGATVNIASRVSHLSRGDDVVFTEAMFSDREVQTEAAQHGELESFETELRGYDQCFRLQRLVFESSR